MYYFYVIDYILFLFLQINILLRFRDITIPNYTIRFITINNLALVGD
jgi:hypothetical protein